jgi:uncharacterized protein with HEPN domain
MPPTLADRLAHILVAIETIQMLLSTKTPADFAADFPLRLAVERALEIICEASRRIPADIKEQQKTIDWQRMVDFGNLLRHAYHTIDPSIVWQIVARDLPPLKAFAERIIREEKK